MKSKNSDFNFVGVALVPTNPNSCSEKIHTIIPFCINFLGVLHYLFATVFLSSWQLFHM